MRFTPASTTPGCFCSVRCTRAWQAAHVMPDTGMRTVRSPSTGGAAVAAFGVGSDSGITFSVRAISSSSLRDDGAVEHRHAAGELVPAGCGRRDLHRGRPTVREEFPDPEGGEDHLLRAGRRLLAVEDEAHRLAGRHTHRCRLVAATHDNA